MRKWAELLAHIHNSNSQYNLPEIGKKFADKANRPSVAEHFQEPSVRKTVGVPRRLINECDELLRELELYVVTTAKHHDIHTVCCLRPTPGESHDINGVPRLQKGVSYARLVKCPRESAGRRPGNGGHKTGNVRLPWAFSDAAVLVPRRNPSGQTYLTKLVREHVKPKPCRSSRLSWAGPCIAR
jgi:hypothetical protein